MTRGFGGRRLATIVAVLALLVQQGLLPVVHFALGGQFAGFAHQASAGPHMHHPGMGGTGAPADEADHGPCHFCRILGTALPPPPVAELMRLEPGRVAFALPPVEVPPLRRFSSAHPARAPPTSSDPHPKIAIV